MDCVSCAFWCRTSYPSRWARRWPGQVPAQRPRRPNKRRTNECQVGPAAGDAAGSHCNTAHAADAAVADGYDNWPCLLAAAGVGSVDIGAGAAAGSNYHDSDSGLGYTTTRGCSYFAGYHYRMDASCDYLKINLS